MTALARAWQWVREHLVWFKPVPTERDNVRGGGVGFRWKF